MQQHWEHCYDEDGNPIAPARELTDAEVAAADTIEKRLFVALEALFALSEKATGTPHEATVRAATMLIDSIALQF
jgi:hypothetical protein